MQGTAGARSRIRDLWRWGAVIWVIGAIAPAIMAWRWGRRRWAIALSLLGLAQLGAFIGLGIRVNIDQGRPWSGIFLALWLADIVAAWIVVPASVDRASPVPWPRPTERARRLGLGYGLGAYVVSFAAVIALHFVLVAAGLHPGLAVDVLSVDALLLASLTPLVLRRADRVAPRDIGFRRTRPVAGAGLALLSLIVYFGFAVIYAMLFLHPENAHETFSRQFGLSGHHSPASVAIDALSLAVIAPVSEEVFFRGVMFRSLRNRLPLWVAALTAGCLFGLAHIVGYPLDTLPIKAFFGVLMCLLYERTGSLWPGIAVHCFVDGSAADALFTGNILIALSLAALALIVSVLVGARAAGRRTYLHGEPTVGITAVPGPTVGR